MKTRSDSHAYRGFAWCGSAGTTREERWWSETKRMIHDGARAFWQRRGLPQRDAASGFTQTKNTQ